MKIGPSPAENEPEKGVLNSTSRRSDGKMSGTRAGSEKVVAMEGD